MSRDTNNFQPGILAAVPRAARYVAYAVGEPRRVKPALAALAALADGDEVVVGVGAALARQLNASIAGLRPFPRLTGAKVDVPANSSALWCWIRNDDRGDILHRARAIDTVLDGAFKPRLVVDGCRYHEGRDLTGYIDGTENPKGAKAQRTAFVTGQGAGLDGASFVAVQQWLHHFAKFEAMSAREQDNAIGRRKRDNVELEHAPASAHVKRTAQEDFDPEAFVLRRSMPWIDGARAGLMFVAFGASFNAFEAQMRRMAGIDDGVTDALFRFTQPLTGDYYWCPPVKRGKLDLSRLLR
ncbi:MAG: Dyp-type peroxidase [Betaproteobacteria bacterium]|nr:Dyp-type peroxidase [Betaproteobacteria bacterium]